MLMKCMIQKDTNASLRWGYLYDSQMCIRDRYEQGKAAGKWVVDTYGTEDSVTVLEITGTMGQSDAQNRHKMCIRDRP